MSAGNAFPNQMATGGMWTGTPLNGNTEWSIRHYITNVLDKNPFPSDALLTKNIDTIDNWFERIATLAVSYQCTESRIVDITASRMPPKSLAFYKWQSERKYKLTDINVLTLKHLQNVIIGTLTKECGVERAVKEYLAVTFATSTYENVAAFADTMSRLMDTICDDSQLRNGYQRPSIQSFVVRLLDIIRNAPERSLARQIWGIFGAQWVARFAQTEVKTTEQSLEESRSLGDLSGLISWKLSWLALKW
jgi:hypothetical protein